MWMIQKVGVNGDGDIDRVQWQVARTDTNTWVGQPAIVPVIVVVDAVLDGKVGSVVPVGDGLTAQGPYVKTFVRADGTEGIEADPSDMEGRSLFDLPRLAARQVRVE